MLRYLIIFLLVCLTSIEAGASSWKVSPSVAFAQVYTDNVDLVSEDIKREEFITELKPTVLINNDGSRLKSTINYSLQSLYYARDESKSTAHHQLNASALSIISPDFFDVSVAAGIQQQVIDPATGVGTDNITGSDNIEDVRTLSIAPEVKGKFGRSITGKLGYQYRIVDYETDESTDTELRSVNLGLTKEQNGDRLNWSFVANEDTAVFDDNRSDEKITTSSITLNYSVSYYFNILATAGYENYELNTILSEDDSEGGTWDLGIEWAPTVRTKVSINSGEQFFGNSKSLNVTHAGKRFTITVGSSEEITSKTELQFSDSDKTGEDTSLLTSPGSDSAFLSERYYINFIFKLRRATTSLYLYEDERTFDISQEEELLEGGNFSYTQKLGASLNFKVSAHYDETTFVNGSVEKTNGAILIIDKAIGKGMVAQFKYDYVVGDGDLRDYVSNMVRAQLSMSF